MTKKDYTKALVSKKKPKSGGIRKSGGATSSKSKKKKLERSKVFKGSRKSDTRYSDKSMVKQLNKITGKRWGDAYDPTIGETKKGGTHDAMKTDWSKDMGRHKNIYLNPPFSQSARFVKKLVGHMKTDKKVKHAMVILPWYQVEDKPGRAAGVKKPQWHHNLDDDMKKLNKKEHHLKNQTFYDPHNKKNVKVRVYGIHLSQEARAK